MSTEITTRQEWAQEITRQVLREHYKLHREEGNDGTASAILFALGEIERVWRKAGAAPTPPAKNLHESGSFAKTP